MTAMRIAIIADIHGNLPALNAVLDSLDRLNVDQIVVAGDIVNGAPDSAGCWERVKSLSCPVLRGNHERYVYDLGTERARPEWSTLQFAPVQFAAAQLGDAARKELAALPTVVRLRGIHDLVIVHASARNDTDLVHPYTQDSELEAMFHGLSEPWIVRGHNHYSGVHLLGTRTVVTAGSIGLPLDGTPRAQFVIMEHRRGHWRPEHHAVAYDIQATVRRFHETHYLQLGGPIAHLYLREVETAAFHIIPFLKFHSAFLAREKGATLADAWAAYDSRGYAAPASV